MRSPFVVVCIRGASKNKSRPSVRRLISGRLRFGTLFVPRIERLLAQGTVASPARLPGSEFIRAAPDASADIISNPKNEGSPENHVHPLKHLSMWSLPLPQSPTRPRAWQRGSRPLRRPSRRDSVLSEGVLLPAQLSLAISRTNPNGKSK